MRIFRSSRGMSLVEVLVALMVFTIATLGVMPLLASSIRGADTSRAGTVGKNIVVEAMERARGLPFHVSHAADAGDVDLLDFYYPSSAGASGGVYTVNCPSGTTDPACPGDIPDDYSVTFRTAFVNPDDATTGDCTSSFAPGGCVTATNYDSNDDNLDTPPRQIVHMSIIGTWTVVGGRSRTYEVDSLIGRRKSARAKLDGKATIDYVVRVLTAFDDAGQERSLGAVGGNAATRVETKTTSIADQSVDAGVLSLVDPAAADADIVPPVEGASKVVSAPPADGPQPEVSRVGGVLSADLDGDGVVEELAGLVGLDQFTYAGRPSPEGVLTASIAGELPKAGGGFLYGNGPPFTGLNLWVDNPDVDRGATSAHQLAVNQMVFLRPAASQTLEGYTTADTQAPNGSGLTTKAHAEFDSLHLFPTTFAPEGVILVEDFVADVSCQSASQALEGPPVAEWSATIRVWQESSPTDGVQAGAYGPAISVSGSAASDPLAAFGPNAGQSNPMVYEDPTNAGQVDNSAPGDVFLFPKTDTHTGGVTHDHPGFIGSWGSLFEPTTSQGSATRPARASIGGALTIDSVAFPMESTSLLDPAPMNISVGSLSCDALDQR
jgi:prepilin-type N-terminal cleavage/methylation domain-containing protein